MSEPRYQVKVMEAEKPLRVRKEASEAIKGAVGGKMMRRMKREYVECPVAGKHVPFLECFACTSFIRRIRGTVHCSGQEFKIKT